MEAQVHPSPSPDPVILGSEQLLVVDDLELVQTVLTPQFLNTLLQLLVLLRPLPALPQHPIFALVHPGRQLLVVHVVIDAVLSVRHGVALGNGGCGLVAGGSFFVFLLPFSAFSLTDFVFELSESS